MTNYDSNQRSDSGDSTSNDLYGRASEAMGGARERASDLVDKARETTSGAYQKVSQSMSSAMDTVSSKMPNTRGIANFIKEEPMVLAGIGVALGAVIGALLPSTEIEKRHVGPTAGSLKEQAKDAARDAGEAAADYARGAYDQGGETLRDGTQAVAKRVQDNPLGALLLAGGIGFALGLLMTRPRRPPPRWRYYG